MFARLTGLCSHFTWAHLFRVHLPGQPGTATAPPGVGTSPACVQASGHTLPILWIRNGAPRGQVDVQGHAAEGLERAEAQREPGHSEPEADGKPTSLFSPRAAPCPRERWAGPLGLRAWALLLAQWPGGTNWHSDAAWGTRETGGTSLPPPPCDRERAPAPLQPGHGVPESAGTHPSP